MPTTSQVNSEDFMLFFEPFLKKGQDILHVTLSSGLSGTYNSANIARQELLEKYPERKIQIIDSLGASSGYGLFIEYLADLRDQGATLEETCQWAEANKLKVHHWFFSTDLTSYKRGGRISGVEALLGNILSICPVMNMDCEGHLIPRKKVRTKRKAIEELTTLILTHAQEGVSYNGKCAICHSDCLEDAQKLAKDIEKNMPQLQGKIPGCEGFCFAAAGTGHNTDVPFRGCGSLQLLWI